MGNKSTKQEMGADELMKKYETDVKGVLDKSEIDKMMKEMKEAEVKEEKKTDTD